MDESNMLHPAQPSSILSSEHERVTDLDWEDWDPSRGNFLHHMLAGSMAGIMEHTVMFPIDTIKTHVQCMRECPDRQPGTRILEMIRGQGVLRLWRGVGTMFVGCVPAHAAYFSVLEFLKHELGVHKGDHQVIAAAAVGGFATVFHDLFMTPMDVIKQRLQLGFYRGIFDCVKTIHKTEGLGAFYRSFPTTLFMNIPYGCIMVAVNETLKKKLRPSGDHSTYTYMFSGCVAGAIAAAATTPLDVVKTRLQTQALNTDHSTRTQVSHQPSKGTFTAILQPLRKFGPGLQPAIFHSNAAVRCSKGCGDKPEVTLQYRGFVDAARQIRTVEGWGGLFRGMLPRLLVHSPSVAISWTTYETAKRWLES